ncbi:MAG: hypothetical protein HGB20_01695 [Chlorobiaceae bacterium]|nr:hypothetical protein [Chlorobiaceae bacterium]
MKKIFLVLFSLCLFSFTASAKQPVPCQKPAVPPCPMMGGMQMSCPMSGVMQTIVEVMKIEQKLLSGSKGIDKSALKMELEQKISALDKQMADMKCPMPAIQASQAPAAGAPVPCPMQNGMPCNMTIQPLK